MKNKCDIWMSSDNPCKITCHTCDKTFATLSMPMKSDILKGLCDSYESRCKNELSETLL
jgi:hypothetical protein